jgi:hypothetical protein
MQNGCPAEVPWRPDPVFMLDVCEAEGQLWLVEVNGFSTSWLYQCDPATVVSRVSELAVGTWEAARRSPGDPKGSR